MRAMLMLLVAMIYQLAERKPSPWAAFCVAALLVLLTEPFAPLSRGFWLSFGAVAGLLWGLGGRLQPPPAWRLMLMTQWIAMVAMLVPLALGGLAQPIVSPLVNVVAVPWVSVLVVPAALLGVLLLPITGYADWPLQFALKALELFDQMLGVVASVPFPLLGGSGSQPWWVVLIALIGTVLLLMPRGFPGRIVSPILIAPMFFAKPPSLPEGELELWVLDVGQGTAVVVRTATHTAVYDTGPRFSDRFDAGTAVVLPALRYLGIDHINLLVLSHSDTDHVGGAAGLLEGLAVSQVLGGQPVAGIDDLEPCAAAPPWVWENVGFQFLHPRSDDDQAMTHWSNGHNWEKDNNWSCVLQIDVGGTRVLLTGDIEERVERALLAQDPQQLSADIVLIPHHGSKTSSSAGFIRAVDPDVAIATAAWRSRFGHPHPSVIARYEQRGVRVLNTATSGAIRIRIDASGQILEPIEWRLRQQRYWFW